MWNSGLPSRRGIASSKAGKAAQFVDHFLRALQENRERQKEGFSLCGPNGRGIWEDPWEDLQALKDSLKHFTKVVHRLESRELSDLLCELSLVIWQLRAWFTIGSAFLILEILDRIAQMPTRLPTTYDGGDPGLAALRLIEGYIFFCVAHHDQLRSEVGHVLSRILRKKRLPPCTSVRVEAALVAFKCIALPDTRLQETKGEDFLQDLALALAPDLQSTRKIEAARSRLSDAVSGTFGAEAHFEFFGSAVNGFETNSSDVDVVVVLPEQHELRNSSKQSAAQCVELMGKKLVENEDDWGIYVTDLVTNARVPVLKCRSEELVDIDITFNNLLPLYNSRLLKAYSALDDRVAKLGRLVKYWAKSRAVNEALEGTLSSYSHCILLLHFLQQTGLLPNLQEKPEPEKPKEMFDGLHDVWFLDPSSDLDATSDVWPRWAMQRPKEATLRGLLTGYFGFLAYGLKAHSLVASIRFSSLHKEDYFRQMLRHKKELEVKVPEAEHEEAEVVGPEVPEDAALHEDDEEHHEDEALDEATPEAEPSAAAPVASVSPLLGPLPGEFEPPALKYKLPPEEHELQQAMSQRQVLCIDDPMEMGRSLGASFQGFERLCFEWRRAFHLLTPRSEVSDAEDLQNLRELFHESNLKAIYQLEKHRVFPTLVDGAAREREPRERSNKIPWAERPERPERRERLAEREQGAPNWSGRSWYNGAAFQGQGTQGPQGPQGPWRGSSKGNNVGPKGKGTLGSGPHGPPAGAGYEPREMREGKGYSQFYAGKDGKGRAEGKGFWQ